MAATLVEQVYNQLLKMIIRRELKPGDRLPSEMVLCDQMGVSRNTLRAALNKLDALGFTVSRQGGGTYVKEVDSDVYLNFFVPALLTHNVNLLEVMQFRKGIEVERPDWLQPMPLTRTLRNLANCWNTVKRIWMRWNVSPSLIRISIRQLQRLLII